MFIVITGAPSSGKTTLVAALQALGFDVLPEAAREVLQSPTLTENAEATQIEIESIQTRREAQSLSVKQLTFLDRGLPDSLAYRRLNSYDETELLAKIDANRYSLVFLCRFGKHFEDGLRDNDVSRSKKIENLLREIYVDLGCKVVDLPWDDGTASNVGVLKRLAIIAQYL